MWFALLEAPVAGLHYHVKIEELKTFVEGSPLTLHREPENIHDKNAVRVDLAGRKIGYIPRVYSPMIAALMDNDYELSCVIDEVLPKKGICDFKLMMLKDEDTGLLATRKGPFDPNELPVSGDTALGQDKG